MLFYYLFLVNCSICNQNKMKEISKNGMTVSWDIMKDSLDVKVFAPTQGWVAIGFNERDELTGTHLVMGCVIKGEVFVEDHYIRQPGDHVPVLSLGGKDALSARTGEETSAGTTIAFRLPLKPVDLYHHALQAGKSYHILMAFSAENDFYHHSLMRTTVKINL